MLGWFCELLYHGELQNSSPQTGTLRIESTLASSAYRRPGNPQGGARRGGGSHMWVRSTMSARRVRRETVPSHKCGYPALARVRKIRAPIKIKSALPPPPQTQIPPPKTRTFMDMGFFLQKERIFPGVHKIGAAISGPKLAGKNFTDTRIFLIVEYHKMCRLKFIQCRTGVWQRLRSLPPDPCTHGFMIFIQYRAGLWHPFRESTNHPSSITDWIKNRSLIKKNVRNIYVTVRWYGGDIRKDSKEYLNQRGT